VALKNGIKISGIERSELLIEGLKEMLSGA
jgi:hypothetical protein